MQYKYGWSLHSCIQFINLLCLCVWVWLFECLYACVCTMCTGVCAGACPCMWLCVCMYGFINLSLALTLQQFNNNPALSQGMTSGWWSILNATLTPLARRPSLYRGAAEVLSQIWWIHWAQHALRQRAYQLAVTARTAAECTTSASRRGPPLPRPRMHGNRRDVRMGCKRIKVRALHKYMLPQPLPPYWDATSPSFILLCVAWPIIFKPSKHCTAGQCSLHWWKMSVELVCFVFAIDLDEFLNLCYGSLTLTISPRAVEAQSKLVITSIEKQV